MAPPEDPGAIREGLSRNTEYGSKARDYGSSGAQRIDYRPGWRDGDFEVLNDYLVPDDVDSVYRKWAAFYNSSGLLRQWVSIWSALIIVEGKRSQKCQWKMSLPRLSFLSCFSGMLHCWRRQVYSGIRELPRLRGK